MSEKRWLTAASAGLLLLTLWAYLGAVQLDFVWDDRALVLDNDAIRSLKNVPSFFLIDLWNIDGVSEESGYYRPLMLLSLAVDHALFGLSAAGYHLHSLLWHLLTCSALLLLLRALVSPAAALAGAAVFALHPIQSEAVIWIAARNDPMAATAALLVLRLLLPGEVSRRRLGGAALLSMLALLAKESVLLLPAALFLLDRVRGVRTGWLRPGAVAAGFAVALLLRAISGVGQTVLPTRAAVSLALEQSPAILTLIGAQLVWPATLCSAWSLEWLALSPAMQLAGLVGLAVLLLAPFLRPAPQRRMALVGLLFAVIFYLPALVPIASKGLIGERYLYLPMVGGVLWLVSVLPRRGLSVLVLLLPLAILRIHDRIPDWSSERGLWEAAVRDVPDPYSSTGLAHALNADDGDRGRALVLFVDALSDPRPYLGACGTPITTALRTGRPALAAQIGWWTRARGCPEDGDFAGRMGVALAAAGDWDEAAAVVGAAAEDPSGRSTVVQAALLRRAGDTAGYDRLVSDWTGAASLEEQVTALLGQEE